MNQDEGHQAELEQQEQLNVCQRIQAIMDELSYLQKGDEAAGGMYKYVSHDMVSAALHPLMVKHGIVAPSSVVNWGHEGNRCWMLCETRYTSTDNPSDYIAVQSLGYGIDSQDKGPGKAMSYATKMAHLKTFMLETGEDIEKSKEEFSTVDPSIISEQYSQTKTALGAGDWATLCQLDQGEDWLQVWSKLTSAERAKFKKLTDKRNVSRDAITKHRNEHDGERVLEAWNELSADEKRVVWKTLSADTQEYVTYIKKENE